MSTVVKETFDIYLSQLAKITRKLSTKVGENFMIYLSQMPEKALKCPPWLKNALILDCLNWLNSTEIVHHGWRKFYNSHVSNEWKST